jgi:hypothetical protein
VAGPSSAVQWVFIGGPWVTVSQVRQCRPPFGSAVAGTDRERRLMPTPYPMCSPLNTREHSS